MTKNDVEGYRIYTPGPIDPDKLGHELTRDKKAHADVVEFLLMGNEKVARSYSERHQASFYEVMSLLESEVDHLKWSGSDLVDVIDEKGDRRKYVLETNSCPSGSLDTPVRIKEDIGTTPYEIVLSTLVDQIEEEGDLAVVWDKNKRGTRAYAQMLSNMTGRKVHYIPLMDTGDTVIDFTDRFRFQDHDIVGAFRYVTQKPWERIPVNLKIPMVNPIIACLSGGRNKSLANKAYDDYNTRNPEVQVNVPETFEELSKEEAIEVLQEWNNIGVIKNPYSNAGQGVFTVTNEQELEEFVNSTESHSKFIVQQLIGSERYSSNGKINRLRHVGSEPINGKRYALDVRMMVVNTSEGYRPVTLYGRRARAPLDSRVDSRISSWDILGTNLSVKVGPNKWEYDEEERQIVATPEGFPKLNKNLEDLVDIYVQACAANKAINEMADRLMTDEEFDKDLFYKLNNDPVFNESIYIL